MTDTRTRPTPVEKAPPAQQGRRAGYLAAVVVNTLMAVIVTNLLGWGWLPFLTDDFELLVPLVVVSLGAGILANLAYLVYDPRWFKSLCQVGISAISLVVAVRMYQVFPFDFAGYGSGWATVTRVVLILAIAGSAVALLVEGVKLLARLARR
jgi:hypothetical protein